MDRPDAFDVRDPAVRWRLVSAAARSFFRLVWVPVVLLFAVLLLVPFLEVLAALGVGPFAPGLAALRRTTARWLVASLFVAGLLVLVRVLAAVRLDARSGGS